MITFVTILSVLIVSFLCSILYDVFLPSIILIIEKISSDLLNPFAFHAKGDAYEIFSVAVGADAMNAIQNIAIGMGLSFAILLLVFSLGKSVFGRYSHDAPDPYKTCVRFILAVVLIYWGSTIMFDYVFPFFGTFIDKVFDNENFTIKTSDPFGNYDALVTEDYETAADFFSKVGSRFLGLVTLIAVCVALCVNMFKIVIENAERYLTTVLITICAPLVGASLVTEKTSEIFSAWCKMILANMLTMFFNILGLKLLLIVFWRIAPMWSDNIFTSKGLASVVLVVGFSKMVQKMDQILSQLTFKINPIANKSLVMGALATVGSLYKSGKAVSSMAKPLGTAAVGAAGGVRSAGAALGRSMGIGGFDKDVVKDVMQMGKGKSGDAAQQGVAKVNALKKELGSKNATDTKSLYGQRNNLQKQFDADPTNGDIKEQLNTINSQIESKENELGAVAAKTDDICKAVGLKYNHATNEVTSKNGKNVVIDRTGTVTDSKTLDKKTKNLDKVATRKMKK